MALAYGLSTSTVGEMIMSLVIVHADLQTIEHRTQSVFDWKSLVLVQILAGYPEQCECISGILIDDIDNEGTYW